MNRFTKEHHLLFLGSALFLIILYFLTWQVPFFWDAVSSSLRSTWFYNNHFSQWVVPTDINAGHLPFWELLLAFSWEFFGRTLPVSRLVLLVFNLLLFYQLIRFINHNKTKNIPFWVYALVLLEPTLIAQTTIINNDIMLLFFTLLGVNSIYKNQRVLYLIALIGVLFSNLRGIPVFGALFIIDALFSYFNLKSDKQKFNAYIFILPLFLFGLFLLYQYQILGWILKIPNNSYREIVGPKMLLKNIAIIIRSFMDHGKLFLFIAIFLLSIQFFKVYTLKNISNNNKRLLIVFTTFFLCFSMLFVVMSNPIGIRYYMVCYLVAIIIFIHLLFSLITSRRWKKISLGFIAIALITGHLWVFPPTIAQSWDSSLLYLNYFPLQQKMDDYIDSNQLNKNEIGTNMSLNIPEIKKLKEPPTIKFAEFNTQKNKYILYSNIENTTSDEDIILLQKHWILVQSFQQMGVFVNLYKNPNLAVAP